MGENVCNKPKIARFLRRGKKNQIQLAIFRLLFHCFSDTGFCTLRLDCILYPHIREIIFRETVSLAPLVWLCSVIRSMEWISSLRQPIS